MKVLVIGGTRLIGRHLVPAALGRGQEITLFNRGRAAPGAFPEVEHIRGDRDGDVDKLAGRSWDAVIDTCGYVPRLVRLSTEQLSSAASHYTFVSSVSVYSDEATSGQDEASPVGAMEDPTVEEITDETYGPLKILCERQVDRFFPGRALILRCGLIVGPFDYTDRFTYWVRRVARGGKVLAPSPPHYKVQVIDAGDMANWMLRMIESRAAGVYNVTGPEMTMETVLHTCRSVSGSDADFIWVDPGFLLARGVKPWSDLPIWLPGPEHAGLMSHDVGKATRAGLTFRPLEDTVRAILEWDRSRPGQALTAGLTAERESELLAEWEAGGR